MFLKSFGVEEGAQNNSYNNKYISRSIFCAQRLTTIV